MKHVRTERQMTPIGQEVEVEWFSGSPDEAELLLRRDYQREGRERRRLRDRDEDSSTGRHRVVRDGFHEDVNRPADFA